jgi:hypothetical protein
MNDKECRDARNTNVPLHEDNNAPIDKEIRIVGRGYITKKRVSVLAECYGKRGITFHEIMIAFKTEKTNAQRRIKYFHQSKVLFTAQDLIDQGIELPPTFKNHIPQKYYATSMKADIIEKIKKEYTNVLVDTTGVNKNYHPLFNSLEQHRADGFLGVLKALPFAPLYMHKINLLLLIGKDRYDELLKFRHETPGKTIKILERMGKAYVNFIFHPNGSVQVFVECSKHPLRIQTDNDVDMFYSIMGRIKEKLAEQVSDYNEWIIPPINSWILKQCDINNDIPITDKAQMSLPDIQIKTVGRVFRMYVKSLGDDAIYRVEESKEVNKPLSSFIDLLKPDLTVLQTIQNLSEKIDYLYRAQRYQTFNPYTIPIF